MSEKAIKLINDLRRDIWIDVMFTPEKNAEDESLKALFDYIAELEALVQRLVEAGDRLSDSLCIDPEEEKTIEVCNWNAIVAEYKECEK